MSIKKRFEMNHFPKDIKKLERADWHLWILTVAVLLIFATFILIAFFYSGSEEIYLPQISEYNLTILFLGFTALSLFFAAYILLKERAIKRLRQDLIHQKIVTATIENRFEELKALFEVSTLVNSETELPCVLDTICKTVLRSLDGDRSCLLLYDALKGKLTCAASADADTTKIEKLDLDLDQEMAEWVMKHKKPLLWNKNDQTLKNLVKENPAFSALYVPLKSNEKIKGVLSVSLFDQRKQFNESDLRLVSIFAENAAISIDKAELYQKIKSRTEILEKTIEDLRSTQKQLVQSEKLRALGDLAGGVTHDFNNMLAVISGRTELLLKEIENEKQKRYLKIIEQVANEAAETVRRLQEFTKTQPEKIIFSININEIIRQVIEVTKSKWKDEAFAKGTKIDILTYFNDVPPVAGNPSELREVFTNLIFNACESMLLGGKIIFRTKLEGESVVVTVTDTGMGMDQEVKKRAFDPFFTTKGVQGIGLGLSVAYGIIIRHQGTIDFESQPGEGTTFIIKLPISKKKVEIEGKSDKEVQISSEPANILLIEDDKEVRDTLFDLLTQAGHKVTIAENGNQGIELFQKGRYDVIFSDLGMPEISGWELSKKIKNIDPQAVVALVTGWKAQIEEKDIKSKGVDFLVSKPFTLEELLYTIREAQKMKGKTSEVDLSKKA
jgi:signal transduction histidine kinase/ActR/RegA family two-component response regulator